MSRAERPEKIRLTDGRCVKFFSRRCETSVDFEVQCLLPLTTKMVIKLNRGETLTRPVIGAGSLAD